MRLMRASWLTAADHATGSSEGALTRSPVDATCVASLSFWDERNWLCRAMLLVMLLVMRIRMT